MAKLNIELDIDWLDPEYSIEESVQKTIEDHVMAEVERKFMKKAMEKFEEAIDEKVSEVAFKVVDDFVETQRFLQPKNSYDKNPEYKTIQEILGGKLEDALNQSVDENGKPTSSNYSRKGTRLEWLTGKLAQEYADEKVQGAVKDIKLQIETFILQKVKGEIFNQLSAEILKKIDFEQIK